MCRARIARILYYLFFVSTLIPAVYSLNGTQCLASINSSNKTLTGDEAFEGVRGMDNSGNFVDGYATAIPYDICVNQCPKGNESEGFDWSIFSKQFTSWLLPYLALISQLPWGAKYRLDNLVSMFLTVGSPMLAAHSLILTVLNGHFVAKRFSHISYPNKANAIRVLSGLQQSPVRVSNLDGGLLASLIVLPQNDHWWTRMRKLMNYEHTWSISAIASIGWVVVAYAFTVADSFSDIRQSFHANGQGAGCLWLWLIPIVVGWLQISPKCDHTRLAEALQQSNEIAYVASYVSETPVLAALPTSGVGSRRAFTFLGSSIFTDELCTSPIFNYARLFSWSHCVEEVATAFEHAADKAECKQPVHGHASWSIDNEIEMGVVVSHNRRGTLDEVIEYCSPDPYDLHRSRVPEGVWRRFLMASFVALALQWCTGGGAMIVNARTPTTGLGCRTGSYMLYSIASTVVWGLMNLSSVLAYASTDRVTLTFNPKTATSSQHLCATLSILLRRIGKVLATLNTGWIVLICILQFINFFNRCLCNSSVWSHAVPYMVVELKNEDLQSIKEGWAAGVATASVACFLFIGFIQLYLEPAIHSD